ncbi:3'-5' exonuclease [Alteromonas facilis]|uniref:3'-5' exonuclease n=1 Tax=Alteromonas facilis TaxID=2048004 RepID=UPI000C288E0A|nr:3'-5' exonuclease [Alteromonas facilis]
MSVLSWIKKLSGGSAQPLPQAFAQSKLQDIPFLAIDLELTSLDVQSAKVLSIGWVAGQAQRVDMSSCYYQVIRTKEDLQQSPVIHGLTDEEIRNGEHVQEAVERLNAYVDSHVWVFHNTGLDIGVLKTVATNLGLYIPAIVTIDTLKLAVYELQKRHSVLPPNSATLSICRDRLDLPAAPAHNALDDAFATLTLWFAQQHKLDPKGTLTLQDIVHTGAIDVIHLGKPPKQ